MLSITLNSYEIVLLCGENDAESLGWVGPHFYKETHTADASVLLSFSLDCRIMRGLRAKRF